MSKSIDFDDGRTVGVLITKAGSMEDIQSMVTLSYRTDGKPLLPDEQSFGVKFPGQNIRKEFVVHGGNVWKISEETRVTEELNKKIGDPWETAMRTFEDGAFRSAEYVGFPVGIGSLFNQGKEDFLPLLFHLVEGSDLSALGVVMNRRGILP